MTRSHHDGLTHAMTGYTFQWSLGGCVVACLLGAAAAPAHAQLTRVSTAADGGLANGASTMGAMTPDGRYVAFASVATNLVSGDTNMASDVFVKDRQTGAIVRVSVASDGSQRPDDSGVRGVDISDDGNVIAFTSRAAFVAEDTNSCPAVAGGDIGSSCDDIYVHNRTTGQTVLVSVSVAGAQSD
jgi:Tol biopolymer transport system component